MEREKKQNGRVLDAADGTRSEEEGSVNGGLGEARNPRVGTSYSMNHIIHTKGGGGIGERSGSGGGGGGGMGGGGMGGGMVGGGGGGGGEKEKDRGREKGKGKEKGKDRDKKKKKKKTAHLLKVKHKSKKLKPGPKPDGVALSEEQKQELNIPYGERHKVLLVDAKPGAPLPPPVPPPQEKGSKDPLSDSRPMMIITEPTFMDASAFARTDDP